ncbi:PHD-finger protein (macronuclear) [Tetrahymena thermophila SB210]|uniref:Inhibitor of growth protein n=1 Tax=Tetrahymena thermophila (strain SB210) TaxID=312017 RepID=W7XK54_TETTS|nr:PHD-finger protein [Tetrahymena thermophila SB210]EWS74604.1 PHD-finger protein [Tetrahymena thermophila SB210]|eukprot:XP_012652826.1 PHD-finger protein [Tetrahymena thermophila SB210]
MNLIKNRGSLQNERHLIQQYLFTKFFRNRSGLNEENFVSQKKVIQQSYNNKQNQEVLRERDYQLASYLNYQNKALGEKKQNFFQINIHSIIQIQEIAGVESNKAYTAQQNQLKAKRKLLNKYKKQQYKQVLNMSQLEEYLEKINHLPIDVNRQLRLIKELDIRIQEGSRKLQELQEEYLAQLRQAKDKKQESKNLKEKRRNIERLQREVLGQSKEKVGIAEQMYSSVDQSIIELEKDLKKLDEQLRQNQVAQEQYMAREKNVQQETTIKKKPNKKETKHLDKTNKRTERQTYQNVEAQYNDAGFDQNEPKYCYCDKPYYGNMIYCESEYCEREWFHYECVGITEAPEGSWFCKDCLKKQKK